MRMPDPGGSLLGLRETDLDILPLGGSSVAKGGQSTNNYCKSQFTLPGPTLRDSRQIGTVRTHGFQPHLYPDP
jgi:hypothetical protein